MGLRFHKSISIMKGVKLNVSKSGVGVSLGTNGCRYSLNSSGRRTATVGIPGTGLSYSKTFSSGKKKTTAAKTKQEEIKKQKAALAEQKADELKQNELAAEEAANYVELIKSVHKECEDDLDWGALLEQAPPYVKGNKGPNEQEAEKALEAYKPSFSEKLFASKATKKEELENAVYEARKADEEAFKGWQESVKFAQRIINGDIDAYLDAINEANPFEDLVEYGSGFEFGTDNPEVMEIEFAVKSEDVVPKTEISLLKSGKLSEKEMTKTAYYDLTQDYVCSTAIRLAREIFAVIPVKAVIVHAVDGILDTATGNDKEVTILSVCFERDRFANINFDRIDPSDFVNSFTCNMHFTKTGGFKEVSRLGE